MGKKNKKLSKRQLQQNMFLSFIMLIIAVASVMGYAITLMGLPNMIAGWFQENITSKYMFLLILNLILLVLGCLLDQAPALLLTAPVLLPIAMTYGIDPIQFGVVMVMMTTVGGITPPVGNLLFVASGISGTPVLNTAKAMIPFACALLFSMAICTLFPPLVTFLPNLFG